MKSYRSIFKNKQYQVLLTSKRKVNEYLELKQTYVRFLNNTHLNKQKSTSLKQRTLLHLSKIFNSKSDQWEDDVKFSFIEFSNYIENLRESELLQFFSILSQKQALSFAETLCIDNKPVQSLQQLEVKLIYNIHVEMCQLWLDLNQSLSFGQITDNHWKNIFQSQQNGLLQFYPRKDRKMLNFVVAHDVKTNIIYHFDYPDQIIKNLKHILDIITFSEQHSFHIDFHVGFLTWHHTGIESVCALKLSHPENIVSLTLSSVKLQKLQKFINLINFHSECGEYDIQDEKLNFKCLKRFSSFGDNFKPFIGQIIEQILLNSKISYISLFLKKNEVKYIQEKRNNIILQGSFPYLRFLSVQNDGKFIGQLKNCHLLQHVSPNIVDESGKSILNLFM